MQAGGRNRKNAVLRILHQRVACLRRQMPFQIKETVVRRHAYIVQPIGRYTNGQQLLITERGEDRSGHRPLRTDQIRAGRHDRSNCRAFLHQLANLDDLQHARRRMRLNPPAPSPIIGIVVVPDMHQQDIVTALLHNDAEVTVHPQRPDIGTDRLVDAMKLQSRLIGVELQIEHGQLRLLLLLVVEASKGSGECVGENGDHSADLRLMVAFRPRTTTIGLDEAASWAPLARFALRAAVRASSARSSSSFFVATNVRANRRCSRSAARFAARCFLCFSERARRR